MREIVGGEVTRDQHCKHYHVSINTCIHFTAKQNLLGFSNPGKISVQFQCQTMYKQMNYIAGSLSYFSVLCSKTMPGLLLFNGGT